MDDFGTVLRTLRRARDWRQQDLAERLRSGIARSTIANIEAGRQLPTARFWEALQAECPEWTPQLAPAYQAAREVAATRRQSVDALVKGVGGIPSGPLGGPFLIESTRYVYVFRHSRAPEEIIEHRRIRALASGADGYGLLLRHTKSSTFAVDYEALWGGHLDQHEIRRDNGETILLQRVAFGRALRRNQLHEFAIRSWVTKDPEPATAVTCNFSIPVRHAAIQLHFLGPEMPRLFWSYRMDPAAEITGEANTAGEERPPLDPDDPDWLHPDPMGGVAISVEKPVVGVEYGLAWSW